MPNCKSCGVRIQWAKTENGKAMPIDLLSSLDGNIITEYDGSELICRVLSDEKAKMVRDTGMGMLYKSHFATCPNADKHREAK